MKKHKALLLIIAVLLITLLAWSASAQADTAELVSVASDGTQGGDRSYSPSLSGDGTVVAFVSEAGNLVPGLDDINGDQSDVFAHNLVTGATQLVSANTDGNYPTEWSGEPSINANGTIVAFTSLAGAELVEEGIDFGFSCTNIFVRNLITGTTRLVSVNPIGDQAANGSCSEPSINAEGTMVAFSSTATNLVDGITYLGIGPPDYPSFMAYQNIFVCNLLAGTTQLVSVGTSGTESADSNCSGPSISADGSAVAFASYATNLADDDTDGGLSDIFVRDFDSNTTEVVSVADGGVLAGGNSYQPSINADGSIVAFVSGETPVENTTASANGASVVPSWDIFVRDRNAGVTELVSVAGGGVEPNSDNISPSINADGSIVAFSSSPTSSSAGQTSISAGAVVSAESPLVQNVFVRDRNTGTTKLLSVGLGGAPANGYSMAPSISADGSLVAFASWASNLVQGDANGCSDIFVVTYAPPAKYPIRYEQTHPYIAYTGNWGTGENKSHSGGSIYYTDDPKASITITFRGTRLDWIAQMGPDMGQVWVSIDGGEPVLVDLYSETDLFQQVVWSTGTLDYGVHVIKIYYPEDFEPSEIKPINIDALDVWGVLLETMES